MDHKYISYTGLKRFFYTRILKQINLKIDKTNGDISNTKIRSVDTIETKFPIPAAGETVKRFLGKVITFLRNIKPLESSVSYYVATTGSDITGEGTSVKPFKTIQYTISLIPKNLNGYTATINIDDGTYDESISINGYHSGILVIKSLNSPETLNTLCRVKKATVANCDARIQFHGLYFTQTDDVALSVTGCDMVFVKACQAIDSATSSYAFDFTYSTARLNSCKSLNHRNCIRSYLSDISSESWAESSATEWGISVSGGKLSKVGNQPSGTYGYETIQDGGAIVSKYGAQLGTLQGNLTLYVSPTGSNTTGDGTSAKPFKTIQYALNMIPRDLGGYTAIIQIADGVYDEEVKLAGYSGGIIAIKSSSSPEALNTVCSVRRIYAADCSARLQFYGLYLTQQNDDAFYATGCVSVFAIACQATNIANSSCGFNFVYSTARLSGCKCTNHQMCCRSYLSNVTSEYWVSSIASTYGLFAEKGGMIFKVGEQPSGTAQTLECVKTGGIIVDQYGVVLRGSLQNNVTLYVNPSTGNDSNDGTSKQPFKTIMKAVNTLPKDLGGYTAMIYIGYGTYADEYISIDGFKNGTLDIQGGNITETIVSPKNIRVTNNSCLIRMWAFTITSVATPYLDSYIFLYNSTSVYIYDCIITRSTSSQYAISHCGGHLKIRNITFNNFMQCLYLTNETNSIDSILNNTTCIDFGCYGAGNSNFARVDSGAILSICSKSRDSLYFTLDSSTNNGGLVVKQNGSTIESLTANLNILVDKKSSSPDDFLTLNSALRSLPKDLGGKTVVIQLSSENASNEDIIISDFKNGILDIQMAPHESDYTASLGRITIRNCTAQILLTDIELGLSIGTPVAVLITDCPNVQLENVIITYATSSYDGFQIARSNVTMINCQVSSRKNGIKVYEQSNVALGGCFIMDNKVGIQSSESCIVTIMDNTQVSYNGKNFDTGNGAKVFKENGTQISEIVNSGLSCTWGTIGGGIVRNGITGGTGMITVQLRITLSTALASGTNYTITGFPKPPLDIACAAGDQSNTKNCYIDSTGRFIFNPLNNVNSGSVLVFNCTYLTTS